METRRRRISPAGSRPGTCRGSAGNAIVLLLAVLVLGGFLALILGFKVATGDYRSLVIWTLVGAVIAYVTVLHRFSWFLIFLTLSLGFLMRPLGFEINEIHIAFGLCMGIAALHILSSDGRKPSPVVLDSGLRALQFICIVWLVYLGAHFVYNKTYPYVHGQFSLKNSIKAYFPAAMAPALILYFSFRGQGIRLPKNWRMLLTIAIFFGATANSAYRLYLISLGVSSYGEGRDVFYELGPIYIPMINLMPGFFVLRELSPIGAGFVALLMTDFKWMAKRAPLARLFVYATYGMTIFGGLVSGGRASILLCGLFTLGVLIYRRRMILVMVGCFGTILFLASVNIFSGFINRNAPYDVARTLQYFMIDKGASAESIEGSTWWRDELRQRSLTDWQKDSRVFWTGRSVFSNMGDSMTLKQIFGATEGSIQNALARGATHNLVTDILIQYGLAGGIVYAILTLLLLRFLIKLLFRRRALTPEVRDTVFLVFMLVAVNAALAPIAGTWVSFWAAWLLVTAIIAQAEATPETAPEPVRRTLSPPLRGRPQGHAPGGMRTLPAAR